MRARAGKVIPLKTMMERRDVRDRHLQADAGFFSAVADLADRCATGLQGILPQV
jgi:hypothetical protein